ncbi:MAG: hypothetical protein ACI8YW_001527, partial [Flavobacteriaceae bacterium]
LFYYNFNQVFASSTNSKSLRQDFNYPDLLKTQIPTYFLSGDFSIGQRPNK